MPYSLSALAYPHSHTDSDKTATSTNKQPPSATPYPYQLSFAINITNWYNIAGSHLRPLYSCSACRKPARGNVRHDAISLVEGFRHAPANISSRESVYKYVLVVDGWLACASERIHTVCAGSMGISRIAIARARSRECRKFQRSISPRASCSGFFEEHRAHARAFVCEW